jgi:hypothetical protein
MGRLNDGSEGSYYGVGIIGFIVGVISTIIIAYGAVFGFEGQTPGDANGEFKTYGVEEIARYVPHVVLLFGIFADAFGQDERAVYSVSSAIGIVSMLFQKAIDLMLIKVAPRIMSAFVKPPTAVSGGAVVVTPPRPRTANTFPTPATATTPAEIGNIAGFEWLSGMLEPPQYFSQSTTTMTTIFMYYIIDAMKSQQNKAIAPLVLFLLAIGAHTTLLKQNYKITGSSLLLGLTFGGIAYWAVSWLHSDWLMSKHKLEKKDEEDSDSKKDEPDCTGADCDK